MEITGGKEKQLPSDIEDIREAIRRLEEAINGFSTTLATVKEAFHRVTLIAGVFTATVERLLVEMELEQEESNNE